MARGCMGCAGAVVVVAVFGLVVLLVLGGPGGTPTASSPTDAGNLPVAAEATPNVAPATPNVAASNSAATLPEVDPPNVEELRAAIRGVLPALKELDTRARRIRSDHYVRVAELHADFAGKMAAFDTIGGPAECRQQVDAAAEAIMAWHAATIPTDATPAEAAKARADAERRYGAAVRAAEEWRRGPAGSRRNVWQTRATEAAEAKRQDVRLYAFLAVLTEAGLAGDLVAAALFNGQKTELTMAEDWHYLPYPVRRAAAADLYRLAAAFNPGCTLELVDGGGRRVGGSAAGNPASVDVIP
jgi:hypothetical protein